MDYDFVKVKDQPNLMRDPSSNAILNDNQSDYDEYIARRNAAEKAKAEGRDYVFLPEGTDTTRESKASRAARDKFVSRMTSALRIPGGVRDQFKEFEGITGKPVENAKQFRKLIPSIIVGQLGFKEEANRKFFRLKLDGEVRLKNAYIINFFESN